MAVELATAYVSLVPSMDGFAAKLKAGMGPAAAQAGDAAGLDSGQKFSGSFGSTVKRLIGPALAMVSIGAIGAFAGSSVEAFSQLEDATGAASVVFGDSMGTIIAQSKTAASTLGLSASQVIDSANTFGTFGKSAGLAGDDLAGFSTEMTTLAGDLSSFKGTSPEQAIQAIGAALRGESEPIRAYGVLLDDATLKARAMEMGIYDGNGSLTAQQKVLAAQQEILAQTTDAQGDFARTADSTANVAKTAAAKYANMQAVIGGALAPAFTAVKLAASGVFDSIAAAVPGIIANFQTLVGWVQQNSTWLGALATVVGAMVLAWAGYQAVMQIVHGVTVAYTAVQGMLNTVMKANPIGLIALAIVGLVAGFIYLWNNVEGFRAFWVGAWDGIKAAVAAVSEWFTGTLVPALAGAWDTVKSGVSALGDFLGGVWDAIKGKAESVWNAIVDFVQGIPAKFMAGLAPLGQLAATIGDWITAAKDKAVEIFNALVDWVKGVPDRFMDGLNALSELAGKFAGWVLAAKDAAVEKFNDLVDWVRDLPNKIVSALGDVGDILKSAGRSIIEGFWNGLKEKWEDVKDWVGGIGDWIANNKGPKAYDLALLKPAGGWIMQGLQEGMREEIPSLARTLREVTGVIQVGAETGGGMSMSTSSVGTATLTPTITPAAIRAALDGATLTLTGVDYLANSTAARINTAIARGV